MRLESVTIPYTTHLSRKRFAKSEIWNASRKLKVTARREKSSSGRIRGKRNSGDSQKKGEFGTHRKVKFEMLPEKRKLERFAEKVKIGALRGKSSSEHSAESGIWGVSQKKCSLGRFAKCEVRNDAQKAKLTRTRRGDPIRLKITPRRRVTKPPFHLLWELLVAACSP